MRLGPLSYQSAFDLLRAKGYQPVAGSSRFEDERGRTGRIVEAEGRGDTWYAEAEESDTDLARVGQPCPECGTAMIDYGAHGTTCPRCAETEEQVLQGEFEPAAVPVSERTGDPCPRCDVPMVDLGEGGVVCPECAEEESWFGIEHEANSGSGTFAEGFAAGRRDRQAGHVRQLCTTGTGERPPVVKRQGRDYYHGYKAAAEGATSEPSAYLAYKAKHRGMSGMAANGGSSDLRAGARALVTRQQNAMDRFIEYAMDRAGLSREEAERALAVYRREKVIKLDPMSGQFNFKHGAFGGADVLQRAARMTGNPVHLKLDGNFSFGIGSEDDKAMKKNALGIKNPPPGAEHLVPAGEAGAMVGYLPYLGTAYDVSQSTVSGSVELFFATLAAARKFFDSAVRSGDIEQAELRQDAAGHARGKLIDEFDTPRAYLSEHEPNAAAGHCRICGEHLPPGEVICEHHEREGLSNDPRWADLPSWEEARGQIHRGRHSLVENARKNVSAVINAFAARRPHREATCSTDGDTVYSYALPIASRIHGEVVVLDPKESPSATTSGQIRAVLAAFPGARKVANVKHVPGHGVISAHGEPMRANAGPESCDECGGDFEMDGSGVANHLTEDGDVDYDADADHVPYSSEHESNAGGGATDEDDVILSSGRVVRHRPSRFTPGATEAYPADGGEMSRAEWNEYDDKRRSRTEAENERILRSRGSRYRAHESNARGSKAWFGDGPMHTSYAIKIDGVVSDLPIRTHFPASGPQGGWPEVEAFKASARSTWLRAKHDRSGGVNTVKRFVKSEPRPDQFYAQWTPGDDSLQIWYTAPEGATGHAPNWGLMLDLGGVERRLGADHVAAVLASVTPHAIALGLANDALDANNVKQHEAYTSLARMIDDGDLDDLIRAAQERR